jgi:hypothetical protein
MGGRLVADRVLIEGSTGVGVESSGNGNVTIRDAAIRDQAMGMADTGQGMLVIEAALTADRVQIVRPTGHGIDVRGSPVVQAAATLSDIDIRSVRLRSPGATSSLCFADGSGIRARNDTSLTVRRAVIEGGARGIGIDSFDQHTIEHVLIRSAERTGLCANNGVYQVRNLRIEEVTGVGLDLFGGYMETSDLAIAGTRRIEGDERTGIGVHLHGINTIMDVRIAVFPVTTFLLSENESIGLQLENGSEATLQDGEIAGSEIAIELVNQPGLDLTALHDNVIFRNNATLLTSR